jgi:hypothetical protein
MSKSEPFKVRTMSFRPAGKRDGTSFTWDEYDRRWHGHCLMCRKEMAEELMDFALSWETRVFCGVECRNAFQVARSMGVW